MSPTLKYDVRGVESGQDFDEPIPKGVYRMTVLSCIQTKSSKGNDMLELELEIIKGKFKGRRVWDYVVLTKKSEWKLASLVRALGMKEKGSINPEKLQGKTLTAKVKLETYSTEDDEGDEITKVTNKIASLLPKADAEEAEDEEEEEDGDEEEAEEEDGDEEEEEEDGDEDEEEGYTEEEINGSSKEELKEIISDEELEIRVTKKTKVAALRKKVLEALEAEDLMAGDEEEEEEDEEGDEEEQDYSEMSIGELKEELKERELKVSGKKPALIKRLEKDDEEEEDEGGDDDGDEPF